MGRSTDGAGEQDADGSTVQRREFLTRGGLVAGGAALGAVLAPTVGRRAGHRAGHRLRLLPDPAHPALRQPSGERSAVQRRRPARWSSTSSSLIPVPIAVYFNMTVTLTRQKGWLALYPANATFSGTSSINWFGDFQDLANNAYVELPQTGGPDHRRPN